MGALISTVVWVAITLLGVFVLVNTVASVRNGDTDAVRNGLLLDIVYLLLLLLLKMYGPTVQWGESIEEVKTFFAQHVGFLVALYAAVALCMLHAAVRTFAALILTDDEKLKNFNRRFDAAWLLVSFLLLAAGGIVQLVMLIGKALS